MKLSKSYWLALATPFSSAYSQSLTSAVLSNADATIYEETAPGVLTLNNSHNPVSALQGSAGAAGGNIELFTSSDSVAFNDPSLGSVFANANPTVLTAGFSDASTVTVSGLDGQDWFLDSTNTYDISYGADNFANQWFGDFLTAMDEQSAGISSLLTTNNEGDLFDTFRDSGGFAQMSDPNVSYIDISDSIVSVGLGGFSNSAPRVAALLNVQPVLLNSIFPNGLQISEVAQINGQKVYSFEGVDSGVVLNDGVDSYSATYVVSIPEPSSSLLVLLAGCSGLARRKR